MLNVTLTAPPSRPTRVLRLRQVTEMIGLSRATIYRLMKIKRFPQSITLGIKAVGWVTVSLKESLSPAVASNFLRSCNMNRGAPKLRS